MSIIERFVKNQQKLSNVDSFLNDLKQFMIGNDQIIFPSMNNTVFVEFEKVNNYTVELIHIKANLIGQGDGTKAIQNINLLADKHKVNIVALAAVIEDVDSIMDNDALLAWYEKHGYEETDKFDRLLDETDYRTPVYRKHQ